MPDIPKVEVLAALLVFRLFYLLLPFAAAIVVVLLFERARLMGAWRQRNRVVPPSVPAPPLAGPGVGVSAKPAKSVVGGGAPAR